MKNKLAALFLFFLLLSIEPSWARAGGGGGGRGGGGFGGGFGRGRYGGRGTRWTEWERKHIPHFVIGLAAFIGLAIWFKLKGHTIFLHGKTRKAASLLRKSGAADPMWESAYLQQYVQDAFYRMQHAWMKRDLGLVSDLLSERLYIKYSRRIDHYIRRREINFMENISIDTIRIVSMQDRKVDNHDRFVAYIKGRMSDVMIDEWVTLNEKLPIQGFEDLYYFARYENQWLLCNIMSDFDFWDVAELKVLKE